jgi:hypothetical protein
MSALAAVLIGWVTVGASNLAGLDKKQRLPGWPTARSRLNKSPGRFGLVVPVNR